MFKVSSNPHIRSKDTTARIMQYVVIALLPTTVFGVFHFGLHALLQVLITVATTVLTEYIYDRCMHKKISIGDFSAVVTGLLLALNLPPSAPLWIGVIGENAFWWSRPEFYESCTWSEMFFDNFVYLHHDKL